VKCAGAVHLSGADGRRHLALPHDARPRRRRSEAARRTHARSRRSASMQVSATCSLSRSRDSESRRANHGPRRSAKKMSKSGPGSYHANPRARYTGADQETVMSAQRRIADATCRADPARPGITNLLGIYAGGDRASLEAAENATSPTRAGTAMWKKELVRDLVETCARLRERYGRLSSDQRRCAEFTAARCRRVRPIRQPKTVDRANTRWRRLVRCISVGRRASGAALLRASRSLKRTRCGDSQRRPAPKHEPPRSPTPLLRAGSCPALIVARDFRDVRNA